jgi:exopolysaccharide biosynthesis WecB/TagA/CpsF family protein
MSGLVAVPFAESLRGAARSSRAAGAEHVMSVAIYLHDLSGGGVERQSLIIAEELRREGVDVTLVLHRLGGQLLDQVPAGLRIVNLNSPRTLLDIPRLGRFLRTEHPDILLSNLDLNNVAALLAKGLSFSRTKVVICQHNPISSSFVAGQNWLYRCVPLCYRMLSPLISRAVAVSAGVAEELEELARLPRNRILTINNPVVGSDFQARSQEILDHPWFHEPRKPVFVTAGRLVPLKDHEMMLRALAIHRKRFDSRLMVLGIGPLQQALSDLVVQLGLTTSVDFLGFRCNVLPFFRQADGFLLTSRCEGFGNVIVEALGCGTPVISVRCDHGPAEILDNGRYGVLVESRDPQAMSDAMDHVATLRERFPVELLRRRATDFSYAVCASRYMAMFKDLAPERAWTISVRRPFGLLLSAESARDIACAAIRQRPDDGVALVVTPNIDHIATIRRSPPLARAYQHAARIVCDGWPVQLYARLCSHRVARVTGCAITSELMRMAPYPTWQRFYFVVDSAATEQAVRQWAACSSVACEVKIPPFGFERDAEYCQQLATSIAAHDTTVLIMAVGAPRSEVFVDTHRAILPRCWAFCIGQAVKIELGLVRRAPSGWQAAGLEWLWRLLQEPSRLTKRYVTAAIGFSAAVIADQMRNMRERRS